VERGEMIALLGSSGCGKTTLLRSIAGFVIPDEGVIRVAGEDITRLPPEKRATAMMFQSYALWPHMTVAGNIGYGLRMRGWKSDAIAARVAEMLKLLQLEGFTQRPVTQLSGGQRQRVALGRALAVDPHLLLLDEPMSNLDYKVRLELRHELRALQRRIGITAVYVTHDREEALTLADRIAVIDAGRIIQIGAPEEIFHRPESAFVAGFMGADNALDLIRTPGGALAAAVGERRRQSGCVHIFAVTRQRSPAKRRAMRPMRWCWRGSSRNRCMSATAIATACAPTAPKCGSRHRSASRKGRRRPSSFRARRFCFFQVASLRRSQ
jgi:ABC-type Fe3+/spermidine/putrescine transport system ATPase subunit